MTVASAEGPAIAGMARGTINGSAPGVSPKTPSGCAKTMRRAIRNRITPPAIDSAVSETCISVRKACPPNMNASSTA